MQTAASLTRIQYQKFATTIFCWTIKIMTTDEYRLLKTWQLKPYFTFSTWFWSKFPRTWCLLTFMWNMILWLCDIVELYCNAGRYFHTTNSRDNKHLVIFIMFQHKVTWRLLSLSAFRSRLNFNKTLPPIYTVNCVHSF